MGMATYVYAEKVGDLAEKNGELLTGECDYEKFEEAEKDVWKAEARMENLIAASTALGYEDVLDRGEDYELAREMHEIINNNHPYLMERYDI